MKKSSSKKRASTPSLSSKKITQKTPVKNTDFTELRSLQEIKELIEFVAEKQFDEIELERGDFHLRLRRGASRSAVEAPFQLVPQVTTPSVVPAPAAMPAATTEISEPAAPPAAEESLYIISSPIVGTFYRASSPTVDPFIKIGDAISSGQTLCIVEAMKLMNEIQSDVSGTVAKIFVENAQPVEYGQPLFGIKV